MPIFFPPLIHCCPCTAVRYVLTLKMRIPQSHNAILDITHERGREESRQPTLLSLSKKGLFLLPKELPLYAFSMTWWWSDFYFQKRKKKTKKNLNRTRDFRVNQQNGPVIYLLKQFFKNREMSCPKQSHVRNQLGMATGGHMASIFVFNEAKWTKQKTKEHSRNDT